jgi:hypothetical protein
MFQRLVALIADPSADAIVAADIAALKPPESDRRLVGQAPRIVRAGGE